MTNILKKVTQCRFWLVALLILSCFGCNSDDGDDSNADSTETTRTFYMGFTPWFYEASINAINVTYSRLENHGDMIKHQLLGGIPWQEALDGTAYHANMEAEIQSRLDHTPSSSEVFLAIDSLDPARSSLAPYWGEQDNMPLTGDWASRTWSDPEVIEAYLNYAVDMINRFDPLYFEYGTEISELLVKDASAYADYLVFAEAVYTSLKSQFPDLKVMVSVSLHSPGSADMQTIEANIGSVLAYSDVVGLSVYPYVFFAHDGRGDPANLPENWLSQVELFSDNKPVIVSESGWIGEDLAIDEYAYSASSDEDKQQHYLQELLESANQMDMKVVIWWTATDFDTLWNDTLGQDPGAKIWKDIGLYDGNQNPRLALETWDEWLGKVRE